MFTIGGNSRQRVGEFMVWEVLGPDGELICSFFGGMSFMAAVAACKAFNDKSFEMSGCQDYYATHRSPSRNQD